MGQNTWFLYWLIPPFLYSITNHIDRRLLSKEFKEGGIGTLILFSALLSAIPIPLFAYHDPSVLEIKPGQLLYLAGAGLLGVAVIWFYLKALVTEEASVTIVFYQLVPVFGTVFGYTILGEEISEQELLAMLVILFGTSLMSFRLDGSFRWRTLAYMGLASICWALEAPILKKVAIEENMWRSLFWQHVMMVLVGILIFAFVPFYRKHFLVALRTNSVKLLSLNATNEVLLIGGNIVTALITMKKEVAIILLAEPFQAIFVFILGILLTKFFPGVSDEKIETKVVLQKILAIAISLAGTYILVMK